MTDRRPISRPRPSSGGPGQGVEPEHEDGPDSWPGRAHAHDLGLAHDLPRLLSRRGALAALGLGGLGLAAAACGADAASGGASSAATSAPGQGAAASATGGGQIPEETAGPYPADGSNGRNVLNQTGVVRSDIRSSLGGAPATAEGVPLTIALRVLDTANGSAPLAGAAVYLWHCNRDGQYSMYSPAIAGETYLRGVQEADADGRLSFTSIFPGAYDGRWPHVHFEVYPSVDAAVTASGRLRTSQLAFPADAAGQVYATSGYEASASNLSRSALETDMVFSDGYSLQLAQVTGMPTEGMTATLTVPV